MVYNLRILLVAFILNATNTNASEGQLIDHGPMADVAFPIFGGGVSVVSENDERLFISPVWTGWDENGNRGSAFLNVNLDTGQASLTESFFGRSAFGSFLGIDNLLYFTQGSYLVSYDPNTHNVNKIDHIPDEFPFWFSSDDKGRIYFIMFPNAELMRYSPDSGILENFGVMSEEDWPQYGQISIDDKGWVYISIRHVQANIIGFNPSTGERRYYLEGHERKHTNQVSHHRAVNGNVYIRFDIDDQWRRFNNGNMELLQRPHPHRLIYRNATRSPLSFPDDSRIRHVNIPGRQIRIEEVNGDVRTVEFDYEAKGARIYTLWSYDNYIMGATGLPSLVFDFDANTLETRVHNTPGGILHINAVATLPTSMIGATYPSGAIYKLSISDAKLSIDTYVNDESLRNTIGRPSAAITHSDGKHILIAGRPARALPGGGLFILNINQGESKMLRHSDFPNGHAPRSLVELPCGNIILGTTVGVATGGAERLASEAKFIRLSWPDLNILDKWKPVPDIASWYDVYSVGDGTIIALSSNSMVYHLDPDAQSIIGSVDLSVLGDVAGSPGLQTTKAIIQGFNEQEIYILMQKGLAMVDVNNLNMDIIAHNDSSIPLSANPVLLDGSVYFGRGANLIELLVNSKK